MGSRHRRDMLRPSPKLVLIPKLAPWIGPDVGNCLLHSLDILEDLLRPPVDRLAVFGDRHAPSGRWNNFTRSNFSRIAMRLLT
jgi:hypothetical protein